jgi:hypothetical protein
VNTLSRHGVNVTINPTYDNDCEVLNGWYWVRGRSAEIAVCTNADVSAASILRHETTHAIQDCLTNENGEADGKIEPITSDSEFDTLVRAFGPENAMGVYEAYTDGFGGTNNLVADYSDYKLIRSEVEAFYTQDNVSAEDLKASIEEACAPKDTRIPY